MGIYGQHSLSWKKQKNLGCLEIIILELNYIISLWLCPNSYKTTMKNFLTVDIPGHTTVGLG